ncbi:transmembrane protease serine 2-like [Centropristis striata]|uniref:transmembrane protease serine 2-like n=1 Tax=Centropristis striata TaxID=184440 RepID=UPI0027E0CC26|nr:transmembrane protease serine 2-like [Centropristis striata]
MMMGPLNIVAQGKAKAGFAVYYQCLLGKSCKSGGKCLSSSQWCDGVKDCPRGEDESHCRTEEGEREAERETDRQDQSAEGISGNFKVQQSPSSGSVTSSNMNNNQQNAPIYDNGGFQHDEGRPPPTPQPPSNVAPLYAKVGFQHDEGRPPPTPQTPSNVAPLYDNGGFQHEEGRPPPTPQPPRYVAPLYAKVGFQHEEGRPPPTPQPPSCVAPLYDNGGFQHDEGRPPQPPSCVAVTPTVDTNHTTAPGTPHDTPQEKGKKKCQRKYILCGSLCALLVLAVAILLWYFLYYQCLQGKSCKSGGKCLSSSKRCDGVKDCPNGKDESHCFRLNRTNFMLQSYSSANQTWLPVCADDWNNNHGRAVCEQMGYNRSHYVSFTQTSACSLASRGSMKLKPGFYHGSRIKSHLEHSQSCSANAVKLQCIECGRSEASPSSGIKGVTDAENGAWPWQVSLQTSDEPSDQHVCGGSIISPYWILSAAHCFQHDSGPESWTVRSGDVSLSKMRLKDGNTVNKIITHQQYNQETHDNDIALLKLDTPLTFSRTVRPVCLPNMGVDLSAGQRAWITGWGALSTAGYPDRLKQAQVTVYSRETCNYPYVLDGKVTETMICAGKVEGGADACKGDGGGPLVIQQGGVWWLAGDTSWGIGCGLEDTTGVYSNVTYFVNWVYEQMQNE